MDYFGNQLSTRFFVHSYILFIFVKNKHLAERYTAFFCILQVQPYTFYIVSVLHSQHLSSGNLLVLLGPDPYRIHYCHFRGKMKDFCVFSFDVIIPVAVGRIPNSSLRNQQLQQTPQNYNSVLKIDTINVAPLGLRNEHEGVD